ncbi:uncharacterized protein [Typha angustifolia]|uniref:uncharacterized protein n=1 Tax=Typha angustifolia TaxID=59011 RepID=UPI003C30157F
MQLNPPIYSRGVDPLEASGWLSDIEKMLDTLGYNDQQKVAFAAFMLRGEAEQWWKATERLIKSRIGDVVITWELFLDAFDQKQFPVWRKEKMEEEFLHLRHGPMTVAEYKVKFNALARFVPHQVPNEAARTRRFKHRLNYAICQSLEAAGLIPYADIVERAMALEGLIQEKRAMEAQRSRT